MLEPTETVALTEAISDEKTGSLIGVVLAEDMGKEDNGRLVGKDSDGVGAGAGGLDIWLNELFLFGQGRLGGGGGGWV